MAETYSTYEAKTKFSEVIRKVRAGQRIVIAYRGEEIAEILSADGEPVQALALMKRFERLKKRLTEMVRKQRQDS